MAEQTTTTKQAAVWNPPRLMKLALGGTKSGTKGNPADDNWEISGGPVSCPESPGYRMPNSGEPSSFRPGRCS